MAPEHHRRARLAWGVYAAALAVAGAGGQRLELGAPPLPVLARPTALDEVRQALGEQQRVFEARAGEAKAGEARARASAALRGLALALLAEPSPDTRVVLGLTLASRLAALDKAMQADGFGEAGAMLLARDAAVLAADLPEEQEELDRRMREVFAELSRACGAMPIAGWGARDEADATAADFDRWAGALGEEPGRALRDLGAALAAAKEWPILARGGAALRAGLARGAGAALEGPAWLSPEAREALAGQLTRAVQGLAAPELRAEALRALMTLEAAGEAIALAEQLPGGEATEFARARLAAMLAQDPAQAGPARPLLALALRREALAGERTYVRPLRPAWRVLAQRARESEAGLLAVLGRAIEAGPSDPGVVGAIRSHRRSIESIEGLEALSRVCSGGARGDDPEVDAAWARLAQAALEASRRIEGPENAERMLAFEALLTQAVRMERIGARDRLDLSAEEDSRLCGGRAGEMRSAIDDCRAQWAREWVDQGVAAPGTLTRLGTIEGLLGALDDARQWQRMIDAPGAAARTSVWELSGAALRLAGEDASEQLAETTRLVLASEFSRAADRLTRWREEFALLRLAARVERDALARGMTGGEATGASAIAELGAGAPGAGDPLHAARRAEFAAVCRYASELVAMRRAGAREQERQLRRFVQWRAGALLEALGTEAR